MFADHIGNLTVELVLASAEVAMKTKELKKIFDCQNSGDNLDKEKTSFFANFEHTTGSSTFSWHGARK